MHVLVNTGARGPPVIFFFCTITLSKLKQKFSAEKNITGSPPAAGLCGLGLSLDTAN